MHRRDVAPIANRFRREILCLAKISERGVVSELKREQVKGKFAKAGCVRITDAPFNERAHRVTGFG